jgi:hypothetical protein
MHDAYCSTVSCHMTPTPYYPIVLFRDALVLYRLPLYYKRPTYYCLGSVVKSLVLYPFLSPQSNCFTLFFVRRSAETRLRLFLLLKGIDLHSTVALSLGLIVSTVTIMIMCSIDPTELGPASLINAALGIIVICWLSSLPSSASGGHDRVLAAVCDFPGTCWSLKL